MRRFEYRDEKSDKFWEIEQTKNELTTRWGRLGTNGQSKTKDFADEAAAEAAMQKQIDEKTGKGYQEVAVESGASLSPVPAAAPAAPKLKPAPAAPAPADEPAAETAEADTKTPARAATEFEANPDRPWLAHQPAYRLPTKDFAPLFSRKHPPKDAPKAAKPRFKDTLAVFKSRYRFNADRCDPRFAEAIDKLGSILAAPPEQPEIGEDVAALMTAMAVSQLDFWDGRNLKTDLIVHFFNYFGAEKFVRIFLKAEQISPKMDYMSAKFNWAFSEAGDDLMSFYSGFLSDGEKIVRHLLALTGQEQWLNCQQAVLDNLEALPLIRRPIVALIMPDSREISNRVARDLLAQSQIPFTIRILALTETDEDLKKAAAEADVHHPGHYGSANADFLADPVLGDTLLLERGEAALSLFLPKADEAHIGHLLAHINEPRAVEALATASRRGEKSALINTQAAIVNWPRAAMAALGRLLAAQHRDFTFLRPTFINLCRQHPDDFQALGTWFAPSTLAAATEILNSNQVAETADLDQLPAVLADPPWTKKRINKELKTFALEPLALDPVLDWSDEERRQLIKTTESRYDPVYLRKMIDPAYLFDEHILRLRVIAGRHSQLPPDQRELADQVLDRARNNDVEGLMEALKAYFKRTDGDKSFWPSWLNGDDVGQLPEPMGVAFFNTFAGRYESLYHLDFALARFGLAICPGLLAQFKRRLSADLMEVAARVGLVELAPYMARAFAKLKNLHGAGRKWLLRFPDHAAHGLIVPALGPKSEARDCAAAALRFLNERGQHDLIMAAAGRYQNPEVSAALAAILNESPQDMFPAKIPALPACWQPSGWRPPIVAQGPEAGKALPPAAIDRLGTMLAFPMAEGWYAGLEVVKDLCTKDSLAAFSWDMFNTWLNSGGPSKDKWCFLALGLFGDDETARRLTPYIREWPGLSAHARAVMGLDILAGIGSDVALMQLNGIAQKVKFKGLQDQARAMIQRIAGDRGLSTEELEDRLAPDFGLNEQGSLVLDFGPRQFVVGFDEALKPYVKDPAGKRLPNLPKPAKTDDQALANGAAERFKGLKKDVRTVAGQQILRLEQAMCGRRHWNAANFEAFLVRHPLVRHLTQRLVWAAYLMAADAEGGYSNFGGTPAAFFRVSEDGSYTNAADEPYELPEAEGLRVGLPHLLEMPPEVQAEFGQLFADYELIQPFPQLGRETYSLTEAEKDQTELSRWKGLAIPTGAIIGLAARGWRRGTPQDAGWVGWMYKSFGRGISALMQLNEGFCVGYTEMTESQEVESILIGPMNEGAEHIPNPLALKEADAIIISELIREMEILTRKAEA